MMSSNGDFITNQSGVATWRRRVLKVKNGGDVVADGNLVKSNIH